MRKEERDMWRKEMIAKLEKELLDPTNWHLNCKLVSTKIGCTPPWVYAYLSEQKVRDGLRIVIEHSPLSADSSVSPNG